jgi:hypothetical protein
VSLGVSGGMSLVLLSTRSNGELKCLQRASYIQGEAGESESIGTHSKGKVRTWGSRKWVYMVKNTGPDSPNSPNGLAKTRTYREGIISGRLNGELILWCFGEASLAVHVLCPPRSQDQLKVARALGYQFHYKYWHSSLIYITSCDSQSLLIEHLPSPYQEFNRLHAGYEVALRRENGSQLRSPISAPRARPTTRSARRG